MTDFPFQNALSQDFFARGTEKVARGLLGAVLVRRVGDTVLTGRIVETEAYLSENDAASHSFRGRTRRNEAMFGEAGTLYVYRIYGIHHCVNIVTEDAGRGAAVLLRALEPLAGIEWMQKQRGASVIQALCSGPGKLAQALAFSPLENGASLLQPALFLLPAATPPEVGVSARVGISKAADLPLRFFVAGNRFVSRGKPSEEINARIKK
jgi:DNA-3-methyladenine glycosylase